MQSDMKLQRQEAIQASEAILNFYGKHFEADEEALHRADAPDVKEVSEEKTQFLTDFNQLLEALRETEPLDENRESSDSVVFQPLPVLSSMTRALSQEKTTTGTPGAPGTPANTSPKRHHNRSRSADVSSSLPGMKLPDRHGEFPPPAAGPGTDHKHTPSAANLSVPSHGHSRSPSSMGNRPRVHSMLMPSMVMQVRQQFHALESLIKYLRKWLIDHCIRTCRTLVDAMPRDARAPIRSRLRSVTELKEFMARSSVTAIPLNDVLNSEKGLAKFRKFLGE